MDINEEAPETAGMRYQEVHEVPHPLLFSRIIGILIGTADDSDIEFLVECARVPLIQHALQECFRVVYVGRCF